MGVVKSQDVTRFGEPGFEDEDVGRLETSLLVEGVVGTGPVEGTPDQGARRRWQGRVHMWQVIAANFIAGGREREVVSAEGLTKGGY